MATIFIKFIKAGECKHENDIFKPQTEWIPPTDFPDLSKYDEIAVDLETKDPNLNERMGSGSVVGVGDVVGISLATHDWCAYYPIAHEGGGNMDRRMVLNWLQDQMNTDSTKIFHNAMYDICWLRKYRYKRKRTNSRYNDSCIFS